MKKLQVLNALILTLGMLLASVSTVMAFPPLPSGFYGTVKINGSNISPGTIVSAWINGVEYASNAAIVFGADTVFSFDVPGDDSSTPSIIEGGKAGDLVVFHIGNLVALQTGTWSGGSNVNINLTAVNHAPVITEGTIIGVTMSEDGSPIPFNLTLNATDLDGNTLTWSISTSAGHGIATAAGTGPSKVIGYTPLSNYNGLDTFAVQVSDGNGGTDIITVNVTIQSVNDAPVANDQLVTTNVGVAKVITLTSADVDGDTLTYLLMAGPAHGILTGTIPNLTYTPTASYVGSDSFTFKVNDGTADSNIATISITISAVNLVPIFADVPFSYWANSYIERLYNAGITGGCSLSPLNYCPDSTVTRAQMAVFLLKGIHGSSYTAPAIGTSTGFTDVPVGYWAAAWIKQLAAEGITGGCGTGIYCPDATVTRAQMAIFLLKAEHGSSYLPSAAIGTFTDVPVIYWAASWIERLAVEGITSGCGAGTYCPDAGVTRAQMAVFLVKTFNLP